MEIGLDKMKMTVFNGTKILLGENIFHIYSSPR